MTTIAERILDAFPSGSYALTGLLRLMDIVETTAVPTAAVECRVQPRLLVNPQFVARHAATPETLLMLIMHELHHVLLGHTTLFPRVTPAHNFAFDAVINGLLCRMFPTDDHTRFFTEFYSAEAFPQCLLRPPPGWPHERAAAPAIASLPAPLRRRAAGLHRALYSEAGATYQEVFEALPRLLADAGLAEATLLGGHDGHAADGGLEHRSPILFDTVRSIVERWPQPPDPIQGRSLADVLNASRIGPRPPPSARAELRKLIWRIAAVRHGGRIRRTHTTATPIQTAVPTLERRSVVLRALGQTPLLHQGTIEARRPAPSGHRVHVYLDVSGSMASVLRSLYGAALDCAHLVHPSIHLFSTRIADVSLAQLRRGAVASTGGTDIACVARHMATHGVRRAVVITDGWVGRAGGRHRRTLANARIGVALLGKKVCRTDLEPVANHIIQIPIEDRP